MKRLLEKSNIRRILSALLLLGAVLFGGYILIREGAKIPWQDFELNIGLVALSLFVTTLGYFPAFICWRRILSLYHIESPIIDDLRNFVYSMLGSMLPGGVWQVVGRSMLYGKQQVSGIRVAAASGLEIILIGSAGWIVYLIGFFLYPDLSFIQIGGFYQYLLLIPIVIMLEPHVLAKLNNWILKKVQPTLNVQPVLFSLQTILYLLFMETLTITIGGSAVFIFLNSVIEVPSHNMIPIISAYSFSIAFSNLLFWLPGRMVIKDSALTLALAQFIPLGISLVFAILIRIWSVFTILIPAGIVWLRFDVLPLFQRKLS